MCSKIGLFFILLVCSTFATEKEDDYELFFDRLEIVKGSDIVTSDLNIKKSGPTAFSVNGFVEIFKNLDDEWTIALKILKSSTSDGKYSQLLSYPPNGNKGICAVMKTEYKKYLYDGLKDHSSAPHYDTCPLTPEKFTFTDYTFNAAAFKKLLSVGYFTLKVFLSHLQETDLVECDVYFHVEKK